MTIDIVDIFSIIASAFSLTLGVIAIWLSITFYKMSDKSSKAAEQSASNIEASVRKLETLFDKLYSGTFDMMKDTVTDMRKHVYFNGSTAAESEKITKEIEEKTSVVIAKAVEEIKLKQKSEKELEEYIRKLINESKEIEEDIKTNAIREEIIKLLSTNGEMSYSDIKQNVQKKGLAKEDEFFVFYEMDTMAKDGIVNDPFVRNKHGSNLLHEDAKFRIIKQ